MAGVLMVRSIDFSFAGIIRRTAPNATLQAVAPNKDLTALP